MCVNPKDWFVELPLILLGLRVAYREDLKCSAADLLYGQGLRIPGEFFDSPASTVDRSEFCKQLHQSFQNVKAPNPSHHGQQKVFVDAELKSCTHVFVRVDSVKRPLQHPYEGPYEVVQRDDKFMDVLISGKPHRISIDRLKPAFTCNSHLREHPPDDRQTKVTPSGHRIRFLV